MTSRRRPSGSGLRRKSFPSRKEALGNVSVDSVKAHGLDLRTLSEPALRQASVLLPNLAEGDERDSLYYRNYLGFYIMGLVNNLIFCLTLASAVDLTRLVGVSETKVSVVVYANSAIGVLVRILNILAGSRASSFWIVAASTTCGLMGITILPVAGLSVEQNFMLLLVFVMMMGSMAEFGEACTLGYLEKYPASLMGAFSSGTGTSGVLASAMYLVLSGLLEWSNAKIAYHMLGFVVLYIIAFNFIIKEYPNADEGDDPELAYEHEQTDRDPILPSGDATPEYDEDYLLEEPRQKLTIARIIHVFRQVWFSAINLFFIYFAEYSIQSVAGYVQPCGSAADPNSALISKKFYTCSQFAYQIGVLFSRSSLPYFKVKRIDILSWIQMGNWVVWHYMAKTLLWGEPPGLYYLLISMLSVGLLGGCSYVNSYYIVLSSREIPQSDKDLGMNLCGVIYTVGIVLGLLEVVAFSSFVKEPCPGEVPRPH